jgi:hypothetical protein
MKYLVITLAALALVGSQIACCCPIVIPDIEAPDIPIPTFEVTELQERKESIPLDGAESANVEILFGAGELDVRAGDADQLFSGFFRYNIDEWEPEVTYTDGTLTIAQESDEANWGWPPGNVRNEWELEFTPEIPLEMDCDIGAGEGDLDLTGLELTAVSLDVGAGDFEVRFDEPNEAEMDQFVVNAGASKLEIVGIGNAGPEQAQIQGGVGDITLDLTGAWARSAQVDVTAGVGALSLRLPDNAGVRVEVEGGLSNVDVSGLRRSDDAYVNDAYGEADIELDISITAGIGQIDLTEVSND